MWSNMHLQPPPLGHSPTVFEKAIFNELNKADGRWGNPVWVKIEEENGGCSKMPNAL